MKKKRRRYTRKRRVIVLTIKITVFCIAVISGLIFLFLQMPRPKWFGEKTSQETQAEADLQSQEEEAELTPMPQSEGKDQAVKEETGSAKESLTPNNIYSFLQGPVSWSGKTDWSGSWCNQELAGSKFGAFGCGLCDLANIYSTLTSYDCSPIDMYEYAKTVSTYSPGGGYGAIDWPEMVQTLNSLGFTCELRNKDETFEEFCDSIGDALTAIALVSSYEDASYWEDTEGHYVNLWMYNDESKEIFLGDSGNPNHNRSWIPLEYVYRALKTSGSYQYMLVTSYEESKNTWRHSGILEDWAVPEYYRIKENAD